MADSPTVPMVLSPEAIAEIERRANAPKPIPFVGQMGGPTLSPEILAEIQRRADAAKGGANVSREPLASVAPQESTEPIGPPPPPSPAPAEKTPILDAAKRGLIQAGAQTVLGPAAGFAAGAAYGWQPENAPGEAGLAAKGAESGEVPKGADGRGGGKGSVALPTMVGGGGPVMVSPGGMFLDSVQEHLGKEVPDETFALSKAGTDLQLRGARLHSEADRAFADQQKALMAAQMDAAERARVEHEAVQAQRDAEVKKRLAEIEHFNAQANQKVGADLFSHGPLSGIMGAIAVGLGQYSAAINRTENTAAKLIESSINREIQIQIENIKNAKGNADNAKGLLSMHLQRFGDMDRAIDATKVALYDQAVKQMDAYRADHAAQVSEANYNDMAGKLLNERGLLLNKLGTQIQSDVVKTTKRHEPKFIGGPGTGGKYASPEHVVTVPPSDVTSEEPVHVAVPKEIYQNLAVITGAAGELVGYNQQALALREQLRTTLSAEYVKKHGAKEALKEAQAARTRLEELQRLRVAAEQKAQGEGVTRDAEFARAMKMGVNYTDGILGHDVTQNTDSVIQQNSNVMTGVVDARVRGASGQVVKPSYARDASGRVVPSWEYQGQVYQGRSVAPAGKLPGEGEK